MLRTFLVGVALVAISCLEAVCTFGMIACGVVGSIAFIAGVVLTGIREVFCV